MARRYPGTIHSPPRRGRRMMRGTKQEGVDKTLPWDMIQQRRTPPPTRNRRSLWPRFRRALKMVLLLGVCSYSFWMRHLYNTVTCTDDCTTSTSCLLLPSSCTSTASDRTPTERSFPRVLVYTPPDKDSGVNQWISTSWEAAPRKEREVEYLGNYTAQQAIRKKDQTTLDTVETEDCKLRHDWQKTSFPTCNMLHEVDLTSPWMSPHYGRRRRPNERYRVVGHGFWRDVWIIDNNSGKNNTQLLPSGDTKPGVLKTMRYKHDFTLRNFDRMRRDAVAMDRLTESKFIIDIYSFCGTSSMSEFGEGGDITAALRPVNKSQARPTQIEKLRIGTCDRSGVVLFCAIL